MFSEDTSISPARRRSSPFFLFKLSPSRVKFIRDLLRFVHLGVRPHQARAITRNRRIFKLRTLLLQHLLGNLDTLLDGRILARFQIRQLFLHREWLSVSLGSPSFDSA